MSSALWHAGNVYQQPSKKKKHHLLILTMYRILITVYFKHQVYHHCTWSQEELDVTLRMHLLTYPLFLHLDHHLYFLWQPLAYTSNITPQSFAPLNYKSQCSLCITTSRRGGSHCSSIFFYILSTKNQWQEMQLRARILSQHLKDIALNLQYHKKNSCITAITPNHLGGTSTSYQVSSRLDLTGETASRNKQLISTKGTFGTLKITEFPKLQYLTNQRYVTAGWTTLTYKYKKSKVPPNLKRLQINTRPQVKISVCHYVTRHKMQVHQIYPVK